MNDSRTTRRRFVGGVVAAGVAGLAGCDGSETTQTTTDTGTTTAEAVLPAPVRGDPEAAVTVAVYSDFACPHCARYATEEYPAGVKEYVDNGQIRYEHHDFPIPVSKQSRPAANAARAVQDTEGDTAFWTFAEGLFEQYDSLGPSLYGTLATEVGADPETVRSAAANRRYTETIDADRARGRQQGVRGTPTIFVDGEATSTHRAETVSAAIEKALSQ